jgi:hypothetical protein
MSIHQTEQQKINARGRAIGAKIRIARGWDVEAKDGNFYIVTTASELHALIDNLEKMAAAEDVS